MFGRIIVTLDGSELSEHVLPYAVALSSSLSIPMTLLEVTYTESGRWLPAPEVYDQIEEEAGNYLERLARGARSFGVESVETLLVQGDPAEEILKAAEDDPDTLIAIATHGRSGITRWALGSVTDRIIRHSRGPVLVIRSKPDRPIQQSAEYARIAVPLDGSNVARQVLPYVTALAKSLSIPVTLFQIGESIERYQGYWPGDPVITIGVEERGREYLASVADELREQGVQTVDTAYFHGDPTENILSVARHGEDVLIAISTHGRSGIARWTLGGVADRVVRHAPGAVLVVRAQPGRGGIS